MKWFEKNLIRFLLGFLVVVSPAIAQTDPHKAFFEAIKENRGRDVTTWLLRGVNPNTSEAQFGSPLIAAAAQKSFDALRALLDTPETKVNTLNKAGENALMYAALHGDLDSVKALVSKGALINKPDWTPLHYAASGGHLSVVQYLLENHAFIDASSPNGTTPLMMAARAKHVSVVELLLKEGADPTVTNQANLSAADYLQRHGEVTLAQDLRKRARDFDAKYRPPKPAEETAPATTDKPQ
jgi:ankyrin repeat protein